jgi:hypothetical protein
MGRTGAEAEREAKYKAGTRRKYNKDKVATSAKARADKHPSPTALHMVEHYSDIAKPGDAYVFSDLLGVLMCLCGHLITIGCPGSVYGVMSRDPLTIAPAIRCPRGCHYYVTKGKIEPTEPERTLIPKGSECER